MSGFGRISTDRGSTVTSKRKVRYAPGTAPPKEVRVALSIPKYEVSSSGVTTYFIDVWQSGMCWMVRRRYKEFLTLHAKLVTELAKYGYELPQLPKKRWFEKMIWANRPDVDYTDERRFGLEIYLRIILRQPHLLDRSQAIRNFLNLQRVPKDAYAMENFEYEQHKAQNIRYYEVDDSEFIEDNIYHTEDPEGEDEVEDESNERFSAVLSSSAIDGNSLRKSDFEALLLQDLPELSAKLKIANQSYSYDPDRERSSSIESLDGDFEDGIVKSDSPRSPRRTQNETDAPAATEDPVIVASIPHSIWYSNSISHSPNDVTDVGRLNDEAPAELVSQGSEQEVAHTSGSHSHTDLLSAADDIIPVDNKPASREAWMHEVDSLKSTSLSDNILPERPSEMMIPPFASKFAIIECSIQPSVTVVPSEASSDILREDKRLGLNRVPVDVVADPLLGAVFSSP